MNVMRPVGWLLSLIAILILGPVLWGLALLDRLGDASVGVEKGVTDFSWLAEKVLPDPNHKRRSNERVVKPVSPIGRRR